MSYDYRLIDGLQEMAKGDKLDENGLPEFQSSKLKRFLKNQKLGSRNKIVFEQMEPKFKTCPRYNPCPICDKCMNKASHLYVACQTCNIPICSHTWEDRNNMIKRKNFATEVNDEIYKEIEKLEGEVCNA